MVPQSESTRAKTDEFSLFAGGPIYQLLLRVRLTRPSLTVVKRRIFVISMLAWAPLAVLTAFNGRFLRGANVPFLHDYEVHVRLLVALPLLIAAELIAHERGTLRT